MPNLHYLWCRECAAVRQTYPKPECVHFGKVKRHRNSESSMVVFRFKDGRVSIPWEPGTKVPQGAVREEVRGARAVRKLEREMDAKDLSRHHNYQEKLERMMEPVNHSMREGLRHQMRNATTTFEREYVQATLDRLDRKPVTSGYDPGNHRD